MNRNDWLIKIKQATVEAGTYRPYFDSVIETLAQILETRDNAQMLFEENGGAPTVEHTNKGGATNVTKNPELTIINDLNSQALAYWRDLGLTPAGLKKINDLKENKQKPSFGEALKNLGI